MDSRVAKKGFAVRRRRVCRKCGYRFTTHEEICAENFTVLKRDGRREPFARAKLEQGIRRACAKRPVTEERIALMAEALAAEIEALRLAEIPSRVIGEKALARLRVEDQVAAVRYASVFRRFMQPEDFDAETASLRAG